MKELAMAASKATITDLNQAICNNMKLQVHRIDQLTLKDVKTLMF